MVQNVSMHESLKATFQSEVKVHNYGKETKSYAFRRKTCAVDIRKQEKP